MLHQLMPIVLLLACASTVHAAKDKRMMSAKAAPSKPAPAPPPEKEEAVESLDLGADNAETVDYFGDAFPVFDKVIDHFTARPARAKTFNTDIAHRNNEGMFKNFLRDFAGFDGGGLKINLSLRYGIIDDLDIGLSRQNGTVEVFNTYEFDVRYRFLNQAHNRPVDLAVRIGIDWFNQPNSNASGFFGELLIDRIIANRLLVGGGIIYASSSSGPTKGTNDASSSTGLMLQGDLRIVESLSLSAELTINLAGFHERYPVITFGPKIVTNRHTFVFVFSNSQYMSTDSIITNTYRIRGSDWIFGFHITREIEI